MNDRATKRLIASTSGFVNKDQIPERVLLVNEAGENVDTRTAAELNSQYLPHRLADQRSGSVELTPIFSTRTATCGTTNASAVVTDTGCTAADVGRNVTGTNVPANSMIIAVTAGVSLTLNQNCTGTGSVSLTIATAAGLRILGTAIPNQAPNDISTIWGRSKSSNFFLVKSRNGCLTDGVGTSHPSTSPKIITAVMPLPDGTCLFGLSDVDGSTTTASTYCELWKTTNSTGNVINKVADLAVGGWVARFSFDCHDATNMLVATYGKKNDTAATSPNLNARQLYRSTDGGTTWTLVLTGDAIGNHHFHTPYVAPDGTCWLTTGDTPTDVGATTLQQAVWYSPTGAAGTWTPYVLPDPLNPSLAIQLVGITQHTDQNGVTWMYGGEDASAGTFAGRIVRFKPSDPVNTAQVVYSPSGSWIAPNYAMGTDATYGVIYSFQRTELATNRGRIMASYDGLNWSTVLETGLIGDGPGAGRFVFLGDYVQYDNLRFNRLQAKPQGGITSGRTDALTFHIPGSLTTTASALVVRPDLIGFDFRVVRCVLSVQTAPSSGSTSITPRRGAGGTQITRTSGDPSIATGATGRSLSAQGNLLAGPLLTFLSAASDEMHIDLTTNAGAAGATVTLIVERLSSSPVSTYYG